MADLLTTKEMAGILKLTTKTFRKYISKYNLPFYGEGRNKRFVESEVLKRLRTFGAELCVADAPKSKFKPTIKSPRNKKYRDLLGLRT